MNDKEKLEKLVIKILTNFAKTHPLINGLYEGINPEEKTSPTFYFITKSPFNEKLSDSISDLDFFITNTMKYNCELLEWPISISKAPDHPFLQNKLWTRQ
jgi:hypothetical protein